MRQRARFVYDGTRELVKFVGPLPKYGNRPPAAPQLTGFGSFVTRTYEQLESGSGT